MNRFTFAVLASLGLLAGSAAGPAMAQLPSSKPTVSPYLNLTRRGDPPAINYYNLVRPEISFRQSIQQLQQQTTTNQQAISTLEAGTTAPALSPTGYPAGFQTHLRYFQNLGGARPAVASRPAVQAPARPAMARRY
jgi:hypothetical protein